ncbi:MAG: hypothetical protein PHP17_03065 [Candidatus Omnitrophica bacterium]|nr:hypothetical protein [Candidatus Omnitrophota bacterium]
MVLIVEPGTRYAKICSFGVSEGLSFTFAADDLTEKNLQKKIAHIFKNAPIEAIAFRVLFGADYFNAPVFVGGSFFKKFEKLTDLFPFYIPHAARMLGIFYKNFKNIPLIAFFETSFFTKLTNEESYYAIPYSYHEANRIKKFGFHGIFHEAASGLFAKNKKVISVVLDRQTTVCAASGGIPATISLGYTPLEGIMSRTACGDLDPGIVFYLINKGNYSLFKIDDILKHDSGFKGLTGYDLSFEEFIKLYGRDNNVNLAFEIYGNQILKYIGEGIAIMGGVDSIVFSGCFLPLLQPFIHSLIKKISFLGISLMQLPWDNQKEAVRVSSENSKIEAWLNYRSIEKTIFLSLTDYL